MSHAASEADSGRFLEGLRVLEIGDGVAGAACSGTLLGLGAKVWNVPDRRTAFRRATPTVPVGTGNEASLLSVVLDRSKHPIARAVDSLADLEAVLRGGDDEQAPPFDLIICDRVAASPYGLSALRTAADYRAWVERVNAGAWLTISAFGVTGPRADEFATELTLSASSSLLSCVSDPATGQPLKLAGNQTQLSAAQAGALASCQAVDLASDGAAVHLDLSAQEAAIAMGPMLALAHQLLSCQASMGAKRYGAPASFYRCLDGLIRISAMEDHQWQGVVRAMGSPEWTDKFGETSARIEFAPDIDKGIAEWTKDLTKAQAETTLQDNGVPATAMYRPSEILQSPQLAHRGSLHSFDVNGHSARTVGRPFPGLDSTLSDGASRQRRRLRGLRVLEASHVLAVPLAGALLGALGANVTKIEDVDRIDMYRRRGPYIDGVEGINRAAYFSLVNHSKSSLAIDLEGSLEELEHLIAEADVFIENVGMRRVERMGIGEAYAGRSADQLAVSSTGFGKTGPHSHYRAYAYNLQTSCGLGYLTRNADGEPAEIDLAWADLISGYAIATIVAAWAIGPEGNHGGVIDFAMAELIDARFNEFLAAAALDATSDETVDRANVVSPFAPNGVYACLDGWLAVSVDGDEAYHSLATALGIDQLLDERFSTIADRVSRHRELDAILMESFASTTTSESVALVRAASATAERVATVNDLLVDEHLAERGFFAVVDHPEWGQRRILGVPWRPVGEVPVVLAHPPLLGRPRERALAEISDIDGARQ